MMYFILLVLHDPGKCEDLLEAWENAGVQGATAMHSTGLGRMRGGRWMDDLPLFPSLETLTEHEESFSRTLFTVADTEQMVDSVIQATIKVVGDLEQPDTGFLVVMPVTRVFGLNKAR